MPFEVRGDKEFLKIAQKFGSPEKVKGAVRKNTSVL